MTEDAAVKSMLKVGGYLERLPADQSDQSAEGDLRQMDQRRVRVPGHVRRVAKEGQADCPEKRDDPDEGYKYDDQSEGRAWRWPELAH